MKTFLQQSKNKTEQLSRITAINYSQSIAVIKKQTKKKLAVGPMPPQALKLCINWREWCQ